MLKKVLTLVLVLSLPGCAAAESEPEDEEMGSTESQVVSGGSCAPARAAGAVNKYEKALHDTIAFAEGTRGVSKDGYDVLYSFKKFPSCAAHPRTKITAGKYTSSAAGRYQIKISTWDLVQRSKKLRSFEPNDQERAAEYLIKKIRRATVPTDRPLTTGEFSVVVKKLANEWASLPGNSYGQPRKTEAELRKRYCAALGGCP